jgi:hypothetical protein
MKEIVTKKIICFENVTSNNPKQQSMAVHTTNVQAKQG